MTERFTVKHIMFDGWCIHDTINDKYYDYGKNDLELLCNRLNKLSDENKELKKKLESKQRLINAYENYIETLKEDGVLDD